MAGSGVQGNRERILELCIARPGICKSDIGDFLDLAWGTVDYHVHGLEADGLLASHRLAGRVHFFSPSMPLEDRCLLAALQMPAAGRVADQLSRRDAARVTELSLDLGWSRKVVARCIGHLESAGAVEGAGQAAREHRLTRLARSWLDKLPR